MINKRTRASICAAGLLTLLLFSAGSTEAYDKELSLFNDGYEHYLSYEPEKAVTGFRKFLKDYPQSSARDAAMFWLGKSLLQLRSLNDARTTFSDLTRQCAGSPFVKFAEVELKSMEIASQGGAVRIASKSPVSIPERQVEKRSADEDGAKVAVLKEDTAVGERKLLLAKIEETEREYRSRLVRINDEKMRNDLELARLQKEKDHWEKEKKDIRENVDRQEKVVVRLKERAYTEKEVSGTMLISLLALRKLGVGEIPWRTGDVCNDFVNEQLLYEEAMRRGVSYDREYLKQLEVKHRLQAEEAEYIGRYLTVSAFIDRKLSDIPAENVVETLKVQFSADDEIEKALLASNLRCEAKEGRSFEEIQKRYYGVVRNSTLGMQELSEWVREGIRVLAMGEVSEIYRGEEDYMIFKASLRKLTYSPSGVTDESLRGRIRMIVLRWVGELSGTTELKVVQARPQ